MKPKKTKEELLASLAINTPVEELVPVNKGPIANNKPSPNVLVKDTEDDYEFTRENVKKLISSSDCAIATMMALAEDSEHPRAFEVLANLIKTASDVNKQLMDLQKDRKKLLADDVPSGKTAPTTQTTNNSIFVGSTADLQTFLSNRAKGEQPEINV